MKGIIVMAINFMKNKNDSIVGFDLAKGFNDGINGRKNVVSGF